MVSSRRPTAVPFPVVPKRIPHPDRVLFAKDLALKDLESLHDQVSAWLRGDSCRDFLADPAIDKMKLKRALSLGFAVSKGNRQVGLCYQTDPADLAGIGQRMIESFEVATEFSGVEGQIKVVAGDVGMRIRATPRFPSRFCPAFSAAPVYFHLDPGARIELDFSSAVEGLYVFPNPRDVRALRVFACAQRNNRNWRPTSTPHLEMFSECVVSFAVSLPHNGSCGVVQSAATQSLLKSVDAGQCDSFWRNGAVALGSMLTCLLSGEVP